MIETFIVDGKTYAKTEVLREWDKNQDLKIIGPVGYENLKKQIAKFGQYKPLIVNEEGIVAGGNHRLKIFKEMGIADVWVSVVHAPDESTMLEYSLSDNSTESFYSDSGLANYTSSLPEIDLSMYTVDFTEGINLGTLTQLGENPKEEHAPKDKKEVECPSCHTKFTPN